MVKSFDSKDAIDEVVRSVQKVALDPQLEDSSKAWTQAIKISIGRLGQEYGFPVACSGYSGAQWGEWHYDLCWLDYQRNSPDDGLHDEENHLLGLPLALECEWGNLSYVWEDFQKLLVSRALLKVMVFQEDSKNSVCQITEYLKRCISSYSESDFDGSYVLLGYVDGRFREAIIPDAD